MLGKKTARLSLRLTVDSKNKLKEKANSLNLDITQLLEKIANEPIIFVSKDIRVILEAINE